MTRVYSVKPVALVSGGRHELWHDCIPGVCASVLAMGPSRASRAVEFREYSVVESSIVWASRSLFRFCSAVSQVWSKLVSGIELPVSVATRVPCPCRVPCFRYGTYYILLFKTPIPYIHECMSYKASKFLLWSTMYLFIIYTCKPQGEPARPLARFAAALARGEALELTCPVVESRHPSHRVRCARPPRTQAS